MGVNMARLVPSSAAWKYLICIAFFCTSISSMGFADARNDAQALCSKKLGPGAIAVEDFTFGETSYVCDCRKAYVWNSAGSACKRRQTNDPDTANQQPPDDSREPPSVFGDDGPSTDQPPRVEPPRQKVKRVPSSRRKQRTVRKSKNKRRVRGSAATARRFCRRRYGRRLVNVRVKRSKFYCHYYGKKAVGYNKRVKWKKFKFRNIR